MLSNRVGLIKVMAHRSSRGWEVHKRVTLEILETKNSKSTPNLALSSRITSSNSLENKVQKVPKRMIWGKASRVALTLKSWSKRVKISKILKAYKAVKVRIRSAIVLRRLLQESRRKFRWKEKRRRYRLIAKRLRRSSLKCGSRICQQTKT